MPKKPTVKKGKKISFEKYVVKKIKRYYTNIYDEIEESYKATSNKLPTSKKKEVLARADALQEMRLRISYKDLFIIEALTKIDDGDFIAEIEYLTPNKKSSRKTEHNLMRIINSLVEDSDASCFQDELVDAVHESKAFLKALEKYESLMKEIDELGDEYEDCNLLDLI